MGIKYFKMIVFSDDKKPDVEVSGKEIRFKWNYKEEIKEQEGNEGEANTSTTYWTYNECICFITDTKEEIEIKLENCGADFDTIQYLTDKYFNHG
jgi:hypothetical protein